MAAARPAATMPSATDSALLNIHYYPAAGHPVRRPSQGRLQVRRSGLRHALPARRRLRHLHRLPRPPLDPPSLRRVRRPATPGRSELAGAHDIRMMSSAGRDYDGDGNVDRGHLPRAGRPQEQAAGRHRQRYGAEQQRGRLLRAKPRIPTGSRTPTTDGQCCEHGGGESANAFKSWTARLVKATFNYQMATQGSRRLRPQRQVHPGAAVRLDRAT